MPLNEPKRYVEIDPEAVKVGDEVKIVESYESGLDVTYEGMVAGVNDNMIHFAAREENPMALVHAWRESQDYCSVRAYIVPPQLPTTPGTVIKFYDYNYLRNRIALRGLDGEWYSAEVPGEPLGPIAPAEWTVLFDPRIDG